MRNTLLTTEMDGIQITCTKVTCLRRFKGWHNKELMFHIEWRKNTGIKNLCSAQMFFLAVADCRL
jgi:hypothetical protein